MSKTNSNETVSVKGDVGLQEGALGGKEVLFQALTHIGPAIGIIFIIVGLPVFVGGSVALLLAIALAAISLTALGVVALARKVPSAGGYYSYVSHGIGERAGFVTAWLYILYDPIGPAIVTLFTARIFSSLFQSEGVNIPWWLISIVLLLVLLIVPYIGVRRSSNINLVLGVIETLICIAFIISLLVKVGGHQTSAPFHFFSTSAGIQPVFQGFALTVLLFTGFEGAAPLAEETRNPKKLIPRTVMGSLLGVGILWIIAGYAMVAAWGPEHAVTLATTNNAAFVLAKGVWGIGWILLPFAFFNSALSAMLANQNGGTRVLYALGRKRLLPASLGKTHPRFKTPYIAIVAQTALNAVLIFGLGFLYGAYNAWLLLALLSTIGVIFVYFLGNISVARMYWRDYRSEFRWIRHVGIPIVANLIFLVGLYYSFIPFPAYPISLALWVALVWLAIGTTAAMYLWVKRPEAMTEAAAIFVPVDAHTQFGGALLGNDQGPAPEVALS